MFLAAASVSLARMSIGHEKVVWGYKVHGDGGYEVIEIEGKIHGAR